MHIRWGILASEPPADAIDRLNAIGAETEATVQGFDARYIAGQAHLERAVELADRAIERDEQIADDRAMEIMLYAAGTRQITNALEIGLKEEPHPVAIVIDGGRESDALSAVDRLFEDRSDHEPSTDHLIEYFDITEAERSTGVRIEDAVLERVALLAINK